MYLPFDVVGDISWMLVPDVAATMIAAMIVGLVLTTKIFMSGLDGTQEPKLCPKSYVEADGRSEERQSPHTRTLRAWCSSQYLSR